MASTVASLSGTPDSMALFSCSTELSEPSLYLIEQFMSKGTGD